MAKKFYREDDPNGRAVKYAETQPIGFSEITDQTELNYLYLKRDKKLKEDGLSYVAEFKVQNFGVKKRDGTLTDSNIDFLYTKLSQLLIRLEDGNYDAALFYLNNHLNTITQTDIDNGYTQEIHDKFINDINNYLNQ